MKNRLLSTLGLCRKAGRLKQGFDQVKEAAAAGQIHLILLAEDLSPKTQKEMAYVAEKHKIKLCQAPVTMEDIWYGLGKRTGILGVADEGLSNTVLRTVRRVNEEE